LQMQGQPSDDALAAAVAPAGVQDSWASLLLRQHKMERD